MSTSSLTSKSPWFSIQILLNLALILSLQLYILTFPQHNLWTNQSAILTKCNSQEWSCFLACLSKFPACALFSFWKASSLPNAGKTQSRKKMFCQLFWPHSSAGDSGALFFVPFHYMYKLPSTKDLFPCKPIICILMHSVSRTLQLLVLQLAWKYSRYCIWPPPMSYQVPGQLLLL